MGGVTERMAALGCRLFGEPVFREEYQKDGLPEERIAYEAAKFTLHGMFEAGEIDNFGSNPRIEELQETIIKLTRNQGE